VDFCHQSIFNYEHKYLTISKQNIHLLCFIQRLKAALHAACGKICEQLQTQSDVTIDKQVVTAIGDITFQQIGTFCQDLDAFAR
jgi:hypothetical protein